MNILFLTSGRRTPSSRFRVLAYVPHLRRVGHQCLVRPSHPPQYECYRSLGWRGSGALRRILRRCDLCVAKWRHFDVVVVERELFDNDTTDFEELFRRACGAMVLDVDDAIFLRHPAKYDRLTRLADGVIAGNVYLAEHLRPLNEHVTVVPTVIDVDRYPLKQQRREPARPLVLGWTGSSGGLEYLCSIAGALRQVACHRRVVLHIIADRLDSANRSALHGLEVRFRRWREATEITDLLHFDIGLMPLTDNEWTRHKCGLKLLQYWAVGIPAVVSPVGVNRDLVRLGENGFLADSPDEWISALEKLLDDDGLRQRLGQAGRATVEAEFSVRRQLPRWLAAVEQAVGASKR